MMNPTKESEGAPACGEERGEDEGTEARAEVAHALAERRESEHVGRGARLPCHQDEGDGEHGALRGAARMLPRKIQGPPSVQNQRPAR